jgi:F-type H+-transporting ATPase subunit b
MATPIPPGPESTAGHEGAFPPFDPATFTSTIFWLVVTFGLLYFIMSRLALPRVKEILRVRSGKIHDDLRAAREMRQEANDAAAGYEKTLTEAKGRSQALAAETRAKVKAEQDLKRQSLEAELTQKLQTAETQIAEARATAMANVGQIANEAAAAIVQHITGTPADPHAIASAIAAAKV